MALVALAGGDQHGQRPPTAIAGQMQLGGQPAAATAQRLVNIGGILGSGRSPFSSASGVLVSAHDRGIDDLPVDLADGIRAGLGVGQQSLPDAVSLPAAEPLRAGLPGTVALGQVSPGTPVTNLHKIPLSTRRCSATARQGGRWPAAAERSRPKPDP
jgi:hypothetical protein